MGEWEVRGMLPHGEYGAIAGGPESSFPTADELESMRSAGLEIYVDGKLYEGKGKKKKTTKKGK